jgi:muconolactone delta-isomerase
VHALVICRPVPGGDHDEFMRLVPGETAALRELKAKGLLTEAWSPGRPGAVLVLDVADEAAAASLAAAFPLVKAGLITIEIVPLYPIDLG